MPEIVFDVQNITITTMASTALNGVSLSSAERGGDYGCEWIGQIDAAAPFSMACISRAGRCHGVWAR